MARPGFTSVVVLTLALPLGACTAVFAVIQAVLLRPLPFTEPDRLFVLGEYSRSADTRFVSPVTFDDWHARQKTFEGLAAFRYWETVNLEDATGEPESIRLATGSENLFRVLGVAPVVGRTYREEQNPRGGSEAVISYELWRRRYGGDPRVLGRVIRVRGTPTTIVGVMQPLPAATSIGWGDVWTCWYRYNIQQQRATGYRSRYLTVVGRLAPGVSHEYAVMQRRREWAIRLALGATPRVVRSLVIAEGLRVVLAGTAVGVLAAVAGTPVIRRLLYGIGPTDPVTFAGVPLVLGVSALIACWWPARRASRQALSDTLRGE